MVYGVWWVYCGWITTFVIIRPSQPSLAEVGAGAELGNDDISSNILKWLVSDVNLISQPNQIDAVHAHHTF